MDGVAFGDVIGANAAIVTIALGTGAFITVLPFGRSIRRSGRVSRDLGYPAFVLVASI